MANPPLILLDLYARLDVARDAPDDEIKRAWKRAAFVLHPDRGGDADDFRAALDAYQTLSDPIRRAVYDRRPVSRSRPSCLLARWHEDHGDRRLHTDEAIAWALVGAPELSTLAALWRAPKLTARHRLRTELWGRAYRVWWVERTR